MTIALVHSALTHGLMPCAYYSLRLYVSLLKLEVENEDVFVKHLAAGERAIAAVWHQRFLSAVVYATKFSELKPCVMISQSRDGDLISPVAERLGLRPVRGSSSRGGMAALLTMVNALSQNPAAVHIVDGPRGPKGVVKAGLIRLAQLSGAAIFPLYISNKRAWIFKSWDRFLVAKPFSRALIRWGQPIFVPKKTNSEIFEGIRQEVEKKLIEGHARDDLRWGWEGPL